MDARMKRLARPDASKRSFLAVIQVAVSIHLWEVRVLWVAV